MAAAAAPLTLSAEQIANIPVDKATCLKVGKVPLIAFKTDDGTLLVAPNKCRHFGGKFSPDIEDAATLKCSYHGAKIDAKTMTYTAGPAGTLANKVGNKTEVGMDQPQCTVTMNEDGSATLEMPEGGKEGGCVVS